MITHHFRIPSVNGDVIWVPMTAEEARKCVSDALAQPPVQFDLLEDRRGWQITAAGGYVTQLVRVPPEMNN